MTIPNVDIKKLHESAYLPTHAYDTDVGWDIYALENVTIKPRRVAQIHTGIAIQMPSNMYATIETRSSYGYNGIINHRGIIDPGYTGEIIVAMFNVGINETSKVIAEIDIQEGDRIAQIIFHKVNKINFTEVDNIGVTERGDKGHGSSGR